MPPRGGDLLRRLLEESVQRLNEEGKCRREAENADRLTRKRPGIGKEKNQFNAVKSKKEEEPVPEVVDIADDEDEDDNAEGCSGEDVIDMSEEEDKEEGSTDRLIKGLVFNYLKVVVPSLASVFEDAFTVHATRLQLEEVITAVSMNKENLFKNKAEESEEEEEEHEIIDIADEDEYEDAEMGSEGETDSDEEDDDIVINPFYRPDPEEMVFNEDQLIRGLVHNYLKEKLPELAGVFERSFSSTSLHTDLQLSEVVEHYRKTALNAKGIQSSKVKGAGVGTSKKKADGRNKRAIGYKVWRFSNAEDEVLREAIANADGKIDTNAIATRLNRGNRSIQARIESLKLNNGIHRYKNYSQAEDFTILETLILPRLKQGERLSKIVLSNPHYEQLAQDLNRRVHSVRNRWQGSIQPCLLKFYAGTLNLQVEKKNIKFNHFVNLNLQVEKMLAEHIGDTYSDFSEINWPLVAAQPDFAGHTDRSLKNMYYQVLMNTTKKGLKRKSDISAADIAKYTRENKIAKRINRHGWHQPLIDYFQERTEQLGIKIRDSL